VAVLPVAAIEQHGPHLPVSVDTSLVEGVIQAALPHLADSLPVLFLPTQQVGKSNEHIRYPGTLTLSAQTLVSVWMELGACVARAGIKKLVLFNSHGGQVSVMDIVARDLRTAHDLIVFSSNWFTLPLGEEVMNLFTPAEHRFGIHAGDMETSMMLAHSTFIPRPRSAPKLIRFWVTALPPSWAGRCKTTTPTVRRVTPRWPPRLKVMPSSKRLACSWRGCCRRSAACP
jgi:creatinine amidohydrolase/Fe(II)-dependent formamide hydrolase-like protein